MSQNNSSELHLHPHARWNLVFAYVSLFYFGLCDNIRGPLYPDIIRAFELTNSDGTWFFALTSTMMILSAFTVPILLSRWGYLSVFRVAVALMTASQFVYAASPNFPWLLAGSFILGITIGFLGVIQNVLVLMASSPKHLPRLMNGLHANYGAASLLAPLLVAALIGLSPKFQASFWVTGGLGVALFLTTWMIPGFVEPGSRRETKPVREKLSAEVIYFAAILSSYVLAEILLSTRLAQFARDGWGADPSQASYWTSLFFIGLFLGRLFFTFVPVHLPAKKQLLLGLSLSGFCSIAGLLFSPWSFFLAGLAMGPCYPLAMSLSREFFPHRLEQATTACVVGSGIFIVSMHLGAGKISDSYGVAWALSLAPIFCFFAVALLIAYPLVWRRRHG
jgi:fucose permease